MSLKKQLINYLEYNKTISGNFIFFDELPKEKKIKSTVSNRHTALDAVTPDTVLLSPKEIAGQARNNSNIETNTSTVIESEAKQTIVTEEIATPTVRNDSKKIVPDFSKIELPDLSMYKTLEELKNGIANCQNCVLGSTRNNFVFGEGDPDADIMVIGEAPGADEDEQGMPFVGRAGKLLTDILKAINFERNEVYIANICKCRPPANRKPTTEEIFYCEPYLKKQIDLIKPNFILALGLTAAEALFKKPFKMAESRGKLFDYHGIQTLITYHPAALLRNPSWKRPVWEDVQFLRRLYDEYLETL